MTNDRFAEITRKNMDLIKKANFIIRSSIEQRTEVSGLLLKILSECETEVVFAQILAKQEQQIITQVFNSLQ